MKMRTAKARTKPKTPGRRTAKFRFLVAAVKGGLNIKCTYDGRERVGSPHILGWNDDGDELVLILQFGGTSSAKLPAWRCLRVTGMQSISTRPGPQTTDPSYDGTCKAITRIDVAARR
jgi:hypothetical protein